MGGRLIFLYGPPAVGKLTVAKALSERIGFRVLHNHVTIDAVGAVFDFGTEAFWGVVGRLREDLIATAAREHVDLIYTYVYAPGDEPRVVKVVEAYEREGGRVWFVQLTASKEELLRRVSGEERARHGKITEPAALLQLLDEHDCFQPVAVRPSLELDLGELSADEAAARIAEYVGVTK
ncbi:MAG TPA: AAA family ATPase [Gaiellaceae bacterium]|jgi:chloramphenicol 3-O-phosphotransferase|nr:AAA family ATPase [Gaiellaceae bacterium]